MNLRVEVFRTPTAFLENKLPNIASCLVLDIRLPGVNGLEFQEVLAKAGIHIPIREVLTLVISGLMNKQIAYRLEVSEVTVKIHRGQVMKKMEARSLADLVRMAEMLGIKRTD
jgi:FixJ family two-component response regulator